MEKSSFVSRRISKVDVLLQFFRPRKQGQISQTLDIFERLVMDAETETKLGLMLQPGVNGGERFHYTPEELKESLDEFEEMEAIAVKGRQFLNDIGYVSPRQVSPILGAAPIGKDVEVMPIAMQLPGSESTSGVLVQPKEKAKPVVKQPEGVFI